MGLVELLLTAVWTAGANGFLIRHHLGTAEQHKTLPVVPLQATADGLWLVFHSRRDWAMAFYTPSEVPWQLPGSGEVVGDDLERLLPGLEVPRLHLYAPYYRREEGRLLPLAQMSVDVSEYYFRALLEAYLDLEVRRGKSAYREIVESRSEELLREVPSEHRLEAYLSALADFGGHALAVANELGRTVRRQRAAGKDPCRFFDPPTLLFGLWPRVFGDGHYGGQYFLQQDGPVGPNGGRWVNTRRGLERRDKELFVHHVWADFWSGEVKRDFSELCPERTEEVR